MSNRALAGTWMLVGILLAGLAGFSLASDPKHLISDAELLRAASAHYQIPASGVYARRSLVEFID